MRLPANLSMTGPIGRVLRGHQFANYEPMRDGVAILLVDGLRVEVAWRSDGAELKSICNRLPPPLMPSIGGKRVDNAFTKDGCFIVLMTDGHALRFDWETGQPELRGIDCYIAMPSIGSEGQLS